MASIGVLGAGTWGMALARMLSVNGHDVQVWSALPDEVRELDITRRQKNLPDMLIPPQILFTNDLAGACTGKDIILFAVPSVYVRTTARQAAPFIPEGMIVADAAKGIEGDTLMTMSEIISVETEGKARVVALSGPTHAEEVARDLPTTIVSSSPDSEAALRVQEIFSNPFMRVYTNDDIKGVELCGALKNVMALAAGISEGLGYGDNTKAALITRGLAEMKRLGLKLGCAAETFAGLAGMGDLIVTATSRHSRNNRCGRLIGQGLGAKEASEKVGMVVEGLNALPAAVRLSEENDVQMPIVAAVDRVVRGGSDPGEEVRALMAREMRWGE